MTTIKERFKEKHPRIYARILECQREQGNKFNDAVVLNDSQCDGNFDWQSTKEGMHFWECIWEDTTEKYQIFYDKYPEEFVLPVKWWIKPRNLVEAQLIAKYFDDNKCGQLGYKYFQGKDTLVNKEYSNNGYGYHIGIGHTEITFEQFQQYVLKEPKLVIQEEVTKGVEKNKLIIGKYYRYIPNGNILIWGKNGHCPYFFRNSCTDFGVNGGNFNKEASLYEEATSEQIQWLDACIKANKFISKEEVLKFVEKWSVGSYVVGILRYDANFTIGTIAELCKGVYGINDDCVNLKDWKVTCYPFKSCCKWFATRSEAEAFAKTLTKEVVGEEVKEKFIVGQWYKSNLDGDEYYLKYDKTKPNGRYNLIYYSTFIKNQTVKTNNYIAYTELEKSLTLLTDLSEIQKYLPEGHIDKISKINFEVDQWYKYSDTVFLKFLALVGTENNFRCSERIVDKNHSFTNSNYRTEPITTCDMAEIIDFLPNGHSDKVSKVEYEVGKWYKVEKHSFFGKFLKISEDGRFLVSERVIGGKSTDYREGYYPFEKNYTWIPVTIEELRNFLPAGHIDRQETKTETMEEFKVSDWAVTNMFNINSSNDLKVGAEFSAEILQAWSEITSVSRGGEKWEKNPLKYLTFSKELRKIIRFKYIKGLLGFEISNTLNTFLPCNGFKEFADNYNKLPQVDSPSISTECSYIHQTLLHLPTKQIKVRKYIKI